MTTIEFETIAGKATVSDELIFRSLPEHIQEIARRVIYSDLDMEVSELIRQKATKAFKQAGLLDKNTLMQ